MTDYWVSSKKHYCKVCACWIAGHKNNIIMHEQGDMHKRAVFNQLKEARKREEARQKESNDNKKALEQIEAAAAAASARDAEFFDNPAKDWVVCTDGDSGQIYYHNTRTNESSWTKPEGFQLDLSAAPKAPPKKKQKTGASASSAPALGELAGGTKWTVQKDPASGKEFYFNAETGKSTFDKPDELKCVELPSDASQKASSSKGKWRCVPDFRSGDKYYFNEETSETTWDRPAAFVGPDVAEVLEDEVVPPPPPAKKAPS